MKIHAPLIEKGNVTSLIQPCPSNNLGLVTFKHHNIGGIKEGATNGIVRINPTRHQWDHRLSIRGTATIILTSKPREESLRSGSRARTT